MAMIGRRAAPTKLNASDISDNAITSAHIQADALTHSDLAPNSITASELADNAVDTAAIAADAVDGTKIADNAVDSEHIADDAVTGAKIENSPTIAANLTVAGTATLQGLTTIKPTVAGDQTVLTIDGDSAGNVGNFGIKRNGATLGLIETAYSDINITCQASGADLKINFGDYNNTAIKVKQSNGYVGIGQQGTFDDAASAPDYPLHSHP